jgi:hypothetical protein
MIGGSYVSDARDVTPKAGKAADAEGSKIQMKGTFAENKDGVVACQGQAAALMAKCQPASARLQSAASSLSNRFSPLMKGSSGLYGPRVTSPGGAAVVAAPGNAVKGGSKNEQQQVQKERSVQQPAKNSATLSATHFNIPPVPSSFGPVASYNASAVPAPSSRSIKTAQADPRSSVQSGTNKKEEPWNRCDLTVQCTDGKCQVNMGTLPVLLIAPTCAGTDGMECVVTAPGGLNKQKRTDFLKEASRRFQAQMVKKTASQKWGHSKEDTKRFAAAMLAARDQVPKEERWKLNKHHSHFEMASCTLESAVYQHVKGVAWSGWTSESGWVGTIAVGNGGRLCT